MPFIKSDPGFRRWAREPDQGAGNPRSSPEPALDRVDTLLELLDLARGPAWHADAACRSFPEFSWFPEKGDAGRMGPALTVCDACPVRCQCAAAGARERFGIWGGTTVLTRRKRRQAVSDVA